MTWPRSLAECFLDLSLITTSTLPIVRPQNNLDRRTALVYGSRGSDKARARKRCRDEAAPAPTTYLEQQLKRGIERTVMSTISSRTGYLSEVLPIRLASKALQLQWRVVTIPWTTFVFWLSCCCSLLLRFLIIAGAPPGEFYNKTRVGRPCTTSFAEQCHMSICLHTARAFALKWVMLIMPVMAGLNVIHCKVEPPNSVVNCASLHR